MSLFVSLRMTYTSMDGKVRSERFCFHNDINLGQNQIDELNRLEIVQGQLQAPMYGLPQMAPFDFDTQTPDLSDENHHCYSEVSEFELTPAYNADAPLGKDDLIVHFSPIYHALVKNTPVPDWNMRYQKHSVDMINYHVSSSRELIQNIPGNSELLNLLDQIDEKISKVTP